MKKTEIVLFVLFIISVILSICMVPLGNHMLIITISTLSIVYFYFGFALFNNIRLRKVLKKESYKDVSALRIVGAVITGIALSTMTIGVMYALMFWPGSNAMLIVGVTGIPVILIIVFVKLLMTKSNYYKGILIRIIFWGGLTVMLLLFPAKWFELKYRDYPTYVKAYKAAQADPFNPELEKKLQEEREKVYEQRKQE